MKYFYNGINQICKQIIRPVRAEYQHYDLGSNYSSGETQYHRQDFDLINQSQQKLKVSIFNGISKSQNCIIYLHSANGSRMEVFKYIKDVIKNDLMLVTFDFSGSGMSEGDIVTYGHNEIHDLQTVIVHIQSMVKGIILWGRSMGSVVALLYMQKFNNPLVRGLILDSPFVCLEDVVVQMAAKRTRVPNFILSTLSGYVSNELKRQSGFSLEDINWYEHIIISLNRIKSVKVPAYFITSKQDTVVPAEQTEKLFQNYIGTKQIHYTGDDHNCARDSALIERILQWFKKRNPIFDKVGVGTKIKNRIMQSKIPIKQIDLNCFHNNNNNNNNSINNIKERSATFDDKRNNDNISPRQRTAEQKYLQLLRTQRSLYLERSVSANRVNLSVEVQNEPYFSRESQHQNKIKNKNSDLKEILKLSNHQQNYFNNHFKPVVFTKMPNKSREFSLNKN